MAERVLCLLLLVSLDLVQDERHVWQIVEFSVFQVENSDAFSQGLATVLVSSQTDELCEVKVIPVSDLEDVISRYVDRKTGRFTNERGAAP